MVEVNRDEQAAAFGVAAAEYQRARPSYPTEALEWLLPPDARHVVDLGAGTGQLTRRLIARGLDVTAVEPSPGMRAELSRTLPEVLTLAGSGEEIPLANDSVDAVLCAQAWHWVDVVQGSLEVARVLRPGGLLGLVWNVRDEREEWVAELGRLLGAKTDQDMRSDDPPVGAPFPPVERQDFSWVQTLTPQQVLDLVSSRSYVITLPPDERSSLLVAVAELLDTHPSLAGRSSVELPYVTRCARTSLPASAGAPVSRLRITTSSASVMPAERK